VGERAGEFQNLCQPSTIGFLLQLDGQGFTVGRR
jgi:hypothetical protein